MPRYSTIIGFHSKNLNLIHYSSDELPKDKKEKKGTTGYETNTNSSK